MLGTYLRVEADPALTRWAKEWCRPGTFLTDRTGEIPDTKLTGRVEQGHALESEQCHGRENPVCPGV